MKAKLFYLFAMLVLFLPSLAKADADPYLGSAVHVGFMPNNPGASNLSMAMDNANNRLAIGFTVPSAKTINTFMLYASGVTGTITGAQQNAALRTDSSGAPSGSDTEAVNLSSAPTSSSWNTWTGFTTALSANTQYWIVIKNTNGTPASNYPSWQVLHSGTLPSGLPSGFSQGSIFGYLAKYSTDGGSSWGSGGNSYRPAAGFRIGFSDGSYIGLPIDNTDIDSTDTVYGTRELGVMFTWPSTAPTINISRVGFFTEKAGTPGALRFRIYTGASPSLAGTSSTFPAANITGGSWSFAHFTSPVAIAPNTVVRVVMGVVSGGGSGDDLRLEFYRLQNSSASKALAPFGSLQKTYYNGSSWTETDTKFPAFVIQAANGGEFTVSGGGGGSGIRNQNQASGGSQ